MPQSIQDAAEAVAKQERDDPDSPIVEDAETRAVVEVASRVIRRLATEYLPGPLDSIVTMGLGMLLNQTRGDDFSIGHY